MTTLSRLALTVLLLAVLGACRSESPAATGGDSAPAPAAGQPEKLTSDGFESGSTEEWEQEPAAEDGEASPGEASPGEASPGEASPGDNP